MSALEQLLMRRCWFVPDVMVSGLPTLDRFDFLLCEKDGASTNIHYLPVDIGSRTQTIAFSSLTDHRGNKLPVTIDAPRVLVRSRSAWPVMVVGRESSEQFQLARHPEADSPVPVDLLVMEMGT